MKKVQNKDLGNRKLVWVRGKIVDRVVESKYGTCICPFCCFSIEIYSTFKRKILFICLFQ